MPRTDAKIHAGEQLVNGKARSWLSSLLWRLGDSRSLPNVVYGKAKNMSGDTHVSERIKSCRENLHISQLMLAELAGINPTQLYRFESGKARLRTETAEKIAAALGVSTAWLVHGTLPVARGTQIDPPVPPGGGLTLHFLELPPALAFAVKRLALQNGSTVEMAVLDLVHLGLEALHKKALAGGACAATGGT